MDHTLSGNSLLTTFLLAPADDAGVANKPTYGQHWRNYVRSEIVADDSL